MAAFAAMRSGVGQLDKSAYGATLKLAGSGTGAGAVGAGVGVGVGVGVGIGVGDPPPTAQVRAPADVVAAHVVGFAGTDA